MVKYELIGTLRSNFSPDTNKYGAEWDEISSPILRYGDNILLRLDDRKLNLFGIFFF